ncbi:hypothetical protein [Roseateles terrae]|uniref:Coiled-coil protein SlyX n=1 Tax=Roseateles terrae TaxID=431060 RepID=A0ABR6GX96_9BURK|nr:hypothetical protein [Roseateles terrae]MBB3196317.1 putative coiled-coil protein SlyX [Roseateles terrae]OWQ83933.1 hypothetical protein CDN98_20830 [Roseateles terrae]
MSQVQAWVAVAGLVAGVGLGVAGASWHWVRKLNTVQRLSDHLAASRNLLDQQNTQARRQVEQLQTELAELRLFAERARRKLTQLAEQAAATPAGATAPAAPAPPAQPRASAQEVAQMLTRNDQRRQPAIARADQEDAGFEPTQVDPPDPL